MTQTTPTMKSAVPETSFPKWRLYAAAAGATVAMSTSAQASTIVSSGPIDLKVQVAPNASSDVIGRIAIDGHELLVELFVDHQSATALLLDTGPIFFAKSGSKAKRYVSGAPIHFTGGATGLQLQAAGLNHPGGQFGPGSVTGFVGFHDSANHFGWIKVEVSDAGTPGYPNEIQILGYAYDTTAGETIFAGQTTSAVPEPGTIGLAVLALGAGGLSAWRRARKSGC